MVEMRKEICPKYSNMTVFQHFCRPLSATVNLFWLKYPVLYLYEMSAIALFQDLGSLHGKSMISLLTSTKI